MARKLSLSVSQLNEYVRRLIQQDPLLHEIELKGEISNLKQHQTGTLFFTLKDAGASISCVMYAENVLALQVEPFEGMRAVVSGSVSLYVKSGQYQFYAKELRAEGIGVLYERYLALKDRLEREGLFDPLRKKGIPDYPDTIGVITSPTGAVIHDILSVSLRRDEETRILLCPVRVQGAEAADEIVQAIALLERIGDVSVIVLARGGGSMEDLWTFNEERVVRAVAACKKPVVSAIGHETDFTLCDFAADFRAPTPSAAAECVTFVRKDREEKLMRLKAELTRTMYAQIERQKEILNHTQERLLSVHPLKMLDAASSRILEKKQAMRRAIEERLNCCFQEAEFKRQALVMLSPYQVLSRGYAIVRRNGCVMTDAGETQPGDMLDVVLRKGEIRARVVSANNRPMPSKEDDLNGSEKETESLF